MPALPHLQHGTIFTVHDTDRPLVSDSRSGIVLKTVCENNVHFRCLCYVIFTHRPKQLFTTIRAS